MIAVLGGFVGGIIVKLVIEEIRERWGRRAVELRVLARDIARLQRATYPRWQPLKGEQVEV